MGSTADGKSVVKAFSNINAYSLAVEGKPKASPDRIALAVAGDVQEEIDVVMRLVDDAGFDALDSGSLEDSWRQQPCSPAYCTDLQLDDLIKARASAVRENWWKSSNWHLIDCRILDLISLTYWFQAIILMILLIMR